MRTRQCLSLLVVLTTIGFSPLIAQQKRPLTPYGTLYAEWKAEVSALQGVTPALSVAERRAKKQQINSRYTDRFRDLAKKHVDDDLWIDCLIWVSVEGTPGAAFDEMFDILRDNAIKAQNTGQLQLLMSEFIKLQSDHIDPALSAISETHTSEVLRGAALYALAARTKRHAERNGDASACSNAQKLMERVIAEYPNVSTYQGKNLENATALLEELRSAVAIAKPAPGIQGTTISGDPFELGNTIRGKVAVISFSGHWCGPCVAMHPVQKEILAKFPPERVVVVEINSDRLDSHGNVRKKIEADGLDWLIVTDGPNGPISEQWHITAWPTYFVVDSNGRIRRRVTGNVGRELFTWVEELVSKSE